MKRISGYLLLLTLASCGTADKNAKDENRPPVALLKSANSEAFNRSFGQLLSDYYTLKDNFIAEKDTAAINHSARLLQISTDSLALKELKADSSIITTAQTYILGISAELQGLAGETTLTGKRRSFQMVSDQLFDLIRTVQYDQAVIYQHYCPMAFTDQGANWLSNSPEINNPYIPKKMIDCGQVKDSIDFRHK